jgi:hypothetical protein
MIFGFHCYHISAQTCLFLAANIKYSRIWFIIPKVKPSTTNRGSQRADLREGTGQNENSIGFEAQLLSFPLIADA